VDSTNGLTIVALGDVELKDIAEENVSTAILPDTPFASAAVAFVAPNKAQSVHYHERPDQGDEIIFIYQGAFRLVSGDYRSGIHDTATAGPVYAAVTSGTVLSIENHGDVDVAFFSVFAPNFRPGEIHYVDG
jgi:oxalate decarboxylase/phosphoglucose isomerase-like protein (cupin superfamily)